jgi:flagellar protein FliO/FliZ
MPNFSSAIAIVLLLCLTTITHAQQALGENELLKQPVQTSVAKQVLDEPAPKVGKHVMANTDAGSMILSLLMVLALIGVSAYVLKRFNITQQQSGQLKVVASLSLGVKERIVVAQVGEQQLLLGVTPQQITLIKSLEEPIDSSQPEKVSALTGNVLAFLQKNNFNTKNKQ